MALIDKPQQIQTQTTNSIQIFMFQNASEAKCPRSHSCKNIKCNFSVSEDTNKLYNYLDIIKNKL